MEGKSDQDVGKIATSTAQDGGLKNSLHGVAYQLKLLLMVVLQAGRMMQEDTNFTCTISTEDPNEGKFDDIVFRYRFHGTARVLSIQAKHKSSPEQTVSWQDFANSSPNAPFAIVKYFTSFLEQRKRDGEVEQKLVLCTNAVLDEGVKGVLKAHDTGMLQQTDLCHIFKLIESSCYSFGGATEREKSKELRRIVDLLKESSDCYGLGKLLASAVYNGTRLGLNTRNVQRAPLLANYRNAIVQHILGEKREKTVHHLREEFCNGTLPSGGSNLRKVFESEYQKLSGGDSDVWADARAKGITLKEGLKPCKDPQTEAHPADLSLPENIVTDEVIEEFFNRFLLVCGSRSEDKLSQTVMDFWKQTNATEHPPEDTGDGDKTVAYNEMLKVVFDWMKEQRQPPVPLTRLDIEQLFERIAFGIKYPELRCIGRMYEDSLELHKYHRIKVLPESVSQLPVFKFLCQPYGDAVFHLRSPHAKRYVSMVVQQILQSFQAVQKNQERYEILFFDSGMFQKCKKSIKAVLRLTNFRFILVIVCDGGHPELLAKLIKYNRSHPGMACLKKIILIEESNSKDTTHYTLDEDLLLVSDLTAESKGEILQGSNTCLKLFGTKIWLRHLIDESNGLAWALELLDSLSQLAAEPILLEEQYNTIRDWYIQRNVRPYQSKHWSMWAVRRSLDSTYFREGERMAFGTFFNALKRALGIKLFDDWHIKHIIDWHEQGEAVHPPGLLNDSDYETKVHILLDEAGFGKSTYLTWLGWYMRKERPSWWIVRFNAIEYSTDFEQILKSGSEGMEDTQALRLLFQLVHLALFVRDINRRSIEETDRERVKAERCASLMRIEAGRLVVDETKAKRMHLTTIQRIELRLFREKFNGKQLVILFDGFDEVVPYYKETVYRLFSRWQAFEGINKIYLTSRPYELKSEFDRVFQERAQFHQLLPFNKDSRLISIHIFLRSHVPLYEACEESARNDLLGSLEAIVRCYLAELRNTPLFIRMGLEIMLPLVQEYVDFAEGTISGRILDAINTSLEKLRMVETFVENKLLIASVEKPQTTDAARKTAYALDNAADLNRWAHRMHSTLALFAMFGTSERKRLLSEAEELEALEYMAKVRQGSVKSGLVEGILGLVPLFIHRVFVEYFAADWIYRHKRTGGLLSETLSLVGPRWFGGSRSEVAEFFDRMLIRDGGSKPLHLAAINRSLPDIRSLLKADRCRALETDAGGRTFLHLLTLYTDEAHFKRSAGEFFDVLQLLDTVCVDCHDRVRGWSALDYALMLHYTTMTRYLIKRGATVNTDTLFQQIVASGSNVEEVLHQAASYEHQLWNFRFSEGSSRYLREVPRKIADYLVHEKQLDMQENLPNAWGCHRTALGYCVEKDAAGMFRRLVELAGGPRKVPVDRLLRKAFLDQAVNVIQYLIVECGCKPPENLRGMGLFPVLTRAIECHYMELFAILLRRFYVLKRNPVKQFFSQLLSPVDDKRPDEYYETQNYGPWSFADTFYTIDPYVLRLLCTAVIAGSRYAVRNLLRFTRTSVSSIHIMAIMEAVADQQVHKRCLAPLGFLISKCHDLHAPDIDGRTLLQVAIVTGWTSVGRYLIERKGFDSQHALHWCVSQDSYRLHSWVLTARLRMFRYLLGKYPDGQVHHFRDQHRTTVLHLAVLNRHFGMAKLMVQGALKSIEGQGQRSVAFCSILKDANLADKRASHGFLKWLIEECDQDDKEGDGLLWKAVYQATFEWIAREQTLEAVNPAFCNTSNIPELPLKEE